MSAGGPGAFAVASHFFKVRSFMKGWQTIILAMLSFATVAGLAGCTHSCLTSECGWSDVYRRQHIPLSLELDAAEAVIAPILPTVKDPATVTDPERAPFYLTLQEAFALALENGNVGAQSINAAGQVSDDL